MPNYNLRTLPLLTLALGAVAVTAFLLHSIFNSTRLSYCSASGCKAEKLMISPKSIGNYAPIRQCRTTAILLARGSARSLRDKILLIGKKDSVSEYILPIMHLSKYDTTLTDPSYIRQGLSAVKHGYPITIASSRLRLALFKLGLADAIIVSQEKILDPIDPLDIKYYFRLQPFKIRLSLPEISRTVGISEDSEVVESYINRNSDLFSRSSYSCL